MDNDKNKHDSALVDEAGMESFPASDPPPWTLGYINEKPATSTIKINPAIKTAIIYSIDEIFSYLVEIKDNNNSYFICDNNIPTKFGNMESARQAAKKEKAQEAYLALSKTYEENDLSAPHSCNHFNRYDYHQILLDSNDQMDAANKNK